MKTNIAILLIIGVLTYLLTLSLTDNNIRPIVNEVPDKDSIQKATIANEIPDFTFTDINGKTHTASDYKGKIIILNFWASWCAPCIKEFPNLMTAAKQHKDNVILIALSSDLEETAITRFIARMKNKESFKGLDFNADNILIALDENQAITSGKFQTFKLPETIIIDQKLNMRHKLIGADWSLNDLNSMIEGLK